MDKPPLMMGDGQLTCWGWGGGRLSTQSRLLSCPLCRLLVPRSALIALLKRDYWLTDCHLRGLRPEHFWWYLRGDICSPPARSGYEIFTTFTLQRHIHLVPAVFVDGRMQSKRSNTLSCIILLCVPCCTFHGLGGSFPQSQITCSACSRAVLRCPTAAFCLWCCPACVKRCRGQVSPQTWCMIQESGWVKGTGKGKDSVRVSWDDSFFWCSKVIFHLLNVFILGYFWYA